MKDLNYFKIKMLPIYKISILTIVFALTQISFLAFAQISNEEKYYVNNDRKWLAEVPLWIPGIRGQFAYGNINISPNGENGVPELYEIESKARLDFYFVGRLSTRLNKLWIQGDAFSGKVGGVIRYSSSINNNDKKLVNVTVSSTIPRLVAGYSVWQRSILNKNINFELIPYIGVRFTNIHMKSDLFDSKFRINTRPNWYEPVVGLYIPISYKRFKIEIQGDYGASGSKNSWVIGNRYRYRLSQLTDIQLGWNHVHINYEGIVGGEALKSTIKLFGPTAGVGFRF